MKDANVRLNYDVPSGCLVAHLGMMPSQPWSILHIDFAAPFMGKMFLVIVDAHSKWLDVQVMKSITATKTKKLKIMFAIHGIPKKIVSDNSPTLRVDN